MASPLTTPNTNFRLEDGLNATFKAEFTARVSEKAIDSLKIHKDVSPPTAAALTNYNTFHVEPLLDQAANFLDRAIVDRDKWYGERVELLKWNLELFEFEKIKEIHDLEIKEG